MHRLLAKNSITLTSDEHFIFHKSNQIMHYTNYLGLICMHRQRKLLHMHAIKSCHIDIYENILKTNL